MLVNNRLLSNHEKKSVELSMKMADTRIKNRTDTLEDYWIEII